MTTRARLWQRVSTGGQDEANQLPDLVKWCDSHGYDYDPTDSYVLHGKSASKGKHQAALDRALADMAAGEYEVLVVWQSSRIERRGAFSVFDLARRVSEAGGRIEYVQDAYLNETNEMSDVMLALAATKDRQKSSDISKQVKASHEAKRAIGSAIGRPPWGYDIACRDNLECPGFKCGHIKFFEPTPAGRQYIPLIFQAVIDGQSVRSVAAWLDSENVPTMRGGQWHEGYLSTRLIKNPAYMGQRRNGGTLETEALVSPTQWAEANAALTSRVRPGRDAVKREKALVSPICGACYGVVRDGCPSGKSPMYRIFVGKQGSRLAYYRCTGHGPQRKGCGAMLPLAEVDERVIEAMLDDDRRHPERVFIPGDDRSDEITKLRESGAAAMRAGDYQTATEAMSKAQGLEEQPREAPHWEDRFIGPCADVADERLRATHALCQHQTEGEHFEGLDDSERREYLAQELEIMVGRDDSLLIVTIGPRVWS